MEADREDTLLICPCDHLIIGDFNRCVNTAVNEANKGHIMTIGLKPTRPETGYGYIQIKKTLDSESIATVNQFREKPNKERAEKWILNDTYFWNSGIFCFKASVYLDVLGQHALDIHTYSVLAHDNKKRYENLSILDKKDVEKIPKNSIDYAILEHADNQKMVIAKDIIWNDAGSFDNLIEEGASLSLDKRTHEHVSIESSNTHILNASRSITTIGINDVIIVDTADALLICNKGESQKLKQATAIIEKQSPGLIECHVRTYRPWGYFDILREEPGFKVKKINVTPGKRLSLQKHQHRGEHWVVVEGTATVVRDDMTFVLGRNQSIAIPKGAVHRLENNGDEALSIIETQTGSYLGEDDIERFQDDFKRK